MSNKLTRISLWLITAYFFISISSLAYAAGLINLPETGQNVSYYSSDDGNIRAGVSWDSNRFTDNNNGTVSDTMTGLIWLKNANCFTASDWNTALTLSNSLSNNQCSLTDGSSSTDWRLPNQNELRSLIDYSTYSPALSADNPFQFVQNTTYWTSSSPTSFNSKAWSISLQSGEANISEISTLMPVWPVRGGIDMVIPEVTEFTLPNSTTVLTVPITISAADNKDVSAYCFSELSNSAGCNWNIQKPSDFTFGSKGNKTLFAFVRDSFGNVSGSKSAGVNILYLLNVAISGSGNGSVHSSPMPGISCFKGSSDECSNGFSSSVTLTASPDSATSTFDKWSYACTSSEKDCAINMDDDKTAEATFLLAPKAKLNVSGFTGYDTVQSAYVDAISTIYALESEFSGDWKLDKSKDIILMGGFYADYSPSRNGYSILNGKLTIFSGSLRADRLVIRGALPLPLPQ